MRVRNKNIKIQHTNKSNYNFEIFHNFIKENFIQVGNEPATTLCNKGNGEYLLPEFLMKLFSNLFFYDQIYNQGFGLPNTGQHFRIHGIDTSKENKVTSENLAFICYGTIGTPEEIYNYSKIIADGRTLRKYLNGWLGLLKFAWFGIKDFFYNLWHLGRFITMEQMLDEILKINTGSKKFIDDQLALAKRSKCKNDTEERKAIQNRKTYDKIMYIFMTATAKNYRGQGLGTCNHEWLREYARQNNCDCLFAEATGLGTRKIYSRLGFQEMGAINYEQLTDNKIVYDNPRNRKVAKEHQQCTGVFYDFKYSDQK